MIYYKPAITHGILLITLSALLSACGGGSNGGGTPPPPVTDNTAPTANAGATQHVKSGDTVTLDGSASQDADGDTLTYHWRMVSAPSISWPTIENDTTARPSFVAHAAGEYVVELVVSDGALESAADTVSIHAELANSAPVARAGEDQFVKVGTTVTLDGTSSQDADGDLLVYHWEIIEQPSGSLAALSNAATVRPTFLAEAEGVYIIRLVVSDGELDSAPVTIMVLAEVDNVRPTAVAGADQNVIEGDTVLLDGSASHDPNGDFITYRWRFVSVPAGSAAAFFDDAAVAPTFVADQEGTYVIELIVSDGELDSEGDRVTVSATRANAAPVADAGSDMNVATGTLVMLDGTLSSDANGDALLFAWRFVSRPDGSAAVLADSTTAWPAFTADLDGTYVLELVVNDGLLDSQPTRITVTAETANSAPVADAGHPRTLYLGDTTQLDGSGSYDPDMDPLTYAWTFQSRPAGSVATLDDDQAASPGFTPDVAGDYVFRLVVSDGERSSDPASVVVTAIQPVLVLERYTPASPFDPAEWWPVNLPHAASSSLSKTVTGSHSGTERLAEYRLTAHGQDFTIETLQAAPAGDSLAPRFAGLASGQVIEAGESVTFGLDVTYVTVTNRQVSFTFTVAETGATFQSTYTLTLR